MTCEDMTNNQLLRILLFNMNVSSTATIAYKLCLENLKYGLFSVLKSFGRVLVDEFFVNHEAH